MVIYQQYIIRIVWIMISRNVLSLFCSVQQTLVLVPASRRKLHFLKIHRILTNSKLSFIFSGWFVTIKGPRVKEGSELFSYRSITSLLCAWLMRYIKLTILTALCLVHCDWNNTFFVSNVLSNIVIDDAHQNPGERMKVILKVLQRVY